jgi:hypothetical protein
VICAGTAWCGSTQGKGLSGRVRLKRFCGRCSEVNDDGYLEALICSQYHLASYYMRGYKMPQCRNAILLGMREDEGRKSEEFHVRVPFP